MNREVRESELVHTMLEDRAAFHAEYRKIFGLAGSCSLLHICDRDMIREILTKEFSGDISSEIERDCSAGC